MSGHDARRAPRHRVGTLAPVVNMMTQRALGVTRDISPGGMQLEAAAPLVPDALYQVQVELRVTGERPVRIEGGVQVVRQAPMDDGGLLVGLRFIHLATAERDRLVAWLAAEAQPGPR